MPTRHHVDPDRGLWVILDHLGQVLHSLGELRAGTTHSHDRLDELRDRQTRSEERLGEIEVTQARIAEQVAANTSRHVETAERLDHLEHMPTVTPPPKLSASDWLRLAWLALIVLAGLVAQLPLPEIARKVLAVAGKAG